MPFSLVAITPDQLNSDAILSELEAVANEVADRMLGDYEAGVSTWSHNVQFNKRVTVNPDGAVSIEVDTDDEIYTYVHEGTGPHLIRARRAKTLAFRSGYTAKTQPGAIRSRSGGPSGDLVFRQSVRHPGFEGRHFGTLIKAKWDPFFRREMQRALDRGAKRSNHSL